MRRTTRIRTTTIKKMILRTRRTKRPRKKTKTVMIMCLGTRVKMTHI